MHRLWRTTLLCVATILIAFTSRVSVAAESATIPLWKGGAPGPSTKPQDEPVLFVHRPAADIATSTAVVVCPGGGYSQLALEGEGHRIGEWLNSFGVTAFVLRYRHGGTGHMHPIPMQDGQRAIRTVRSRAAEWGIDPSKIGVMGFSAGGHLSSTLGTHFDSGNASAADPIDRASSRPDFMILCYPVISLTADYTHTGSRDSLLGAQPDPALVRSLSSELQVTKETSPAFLFHTYEDTAVPPENSVDFYKALHKANVPSELHVYHNGAHGVGLAAGIPGTSDWPDRCKEWLQTRGLLDR